MRGARWHGMSLLPAVLWRTSPADTQPASIRSLFRPFPSSFPRFERSIMLPNTTAEDFSITLTVYHMLRPINGTDDTVGGVPCGNFFYSTVRRSFCTAASGNRLAGPSALCSASEERTSMASAVTLRIFPILSPAFLGVSKTAMS